MTSHLGVMVLFAACLSIVFGALMRESPRDEVRLATRILLALVGGAYVVGWIMYLAF
jgi:hypothetical protein